jgi:adenosylmethionine-8-amino-7-oxononanoate aminotransferase
VTGLRRVGGAVAFELAGPEGQPHGYLSNRSRALREVAQRHGALLRPLGDTLYALPPACTTDEELETLAVAFEAMVDSGL